jgi:hypothetical protein
MIGSEQWLKDTEQHFGGYHTGVPRNIISTLAPPTKLNPNGMTGGDRMTTHGYGKYYSKHLEKFLKNRFEKYTIVECGILKGTGLAVWSMLFPNADIIGLDIDLSHTKNNMAFLESKGAFKTGNLELFEFDQFKNNTDYIKSILNGRKIDIAIDDGFHSEESIMNTYRDFLPYLNNEFVYFVEDNRTVYNTLRLEKCNVFYYKQLTVLENV